MKLEDGTKAMILAPLTRSKKGEHLNLFSSLKSEGYMRVRVGDTIFTLEEEINLEKNKKHDIDLVVDRIVIKESARSRIADSVSLALQKGEGQMIVHVLDTSKDHLFSELLSCPNGHGSVPDLDPKNFSFNTPHGACETCSGLGVEQEFSPELVIPNKHLSLADGAILPWSKTNNPYYKALLEGLSNAFNFSLNTPYEELPEKIQEIILYGSNSKRIIIDTDKYPSVGYGTYKTFYEGVINQLSRRYLETSSESWKTEIEKYMVEKPCPACDGSRLNAYARSVKIADKGIHELCLMPIDKLYDFFEILSSFLSPKQEKIAHQLLIEIKSRLSFLKDVGLSYLNLARSAKTLSGGEAQRIRLASQIGSGLTGVLYVLDEPSIGLHQKDNDRLLKTLVGLRDLGNSVLVVEHDEDTMLMADWILDIGRGAGVHGGYLVAEGSLEDVKANSNSLTGDYLSGRKAIKVPKFRREGKVNFISLKNARMNNLKNLDVDFPLGKFIAITGLSGSGKSTLINELLHPALKSRLHYKAAFPKELDSIEGIEELDKVIVIDQSPIGRTPRSNPATYTGLFDPIRELFSQTNEAKARGYTPGRFSFNVKGGRCESCGGAGLLEIEMNFLPSVFVKCDVCKGKRYNTETLEVKFKGKSIYDVLEMTVEDALGFFEAIPKIKTKLQTLHDVGLDYITLGQPATTLSGGEAQRIKLASELSKRSTGKTLYLLDEPTTGLHWKDIQHLLNVLNRLVDAGNTVIVIEHNLDVIKQADHIIDLGPEGGEAGGNIVAQGKPEEISTVENSYTAKYLKKFL